MRSSLRTALLIGLVIGIGAVLFSIGPAGQTLEAKGLDLLFLLRGPHPSPDDIVVIEIDDQSFSRLGLQWPWPRRLHARLTDRLRTAGARVIAFDVLFSEASSPADDTELAEAFARAGNVALATDHRVIESRGAQRTLRVVPLPLFEQARARPGVVNQIQDRDGVIRRARLLVNGTPSFAAVAAQAAGWRGTLEGEPFLINYVGPSPAFRSVSYWEALDPREMPDDVFKDRIVLIGRAVGPAGRPTDDSHYTPFFWQGRRQTPGVEIHASVLDTILHGRPVWPLAAPARWAWTLTCAVVAAVLVARVGPWAGFGVTAGWAISQGVAALVLFSTAERWLTWVSPAIGTVAVYATTVVVRWRRTERERAFIQGAFQRYLHPTVVKELIEDPRKLRLGGESVEATILFTDLAGFTQVAEKLTPAELVALLNVYLGAMTDVVLEHRGMLNQMMGDGVLAIWNVPIASPHHPSDACRAALGMHARLAALNREWETTGGPRLKMRVGIQTGEIVAGNIGSSAHFHYGVLGDTVNLASRLEQVNKLYGTGVVLGDETARRVEDEFVLRELDLLRVVGRSEPVRIYECVCPRGSESEERAAVLGMYAEGLRAYHDRKWQTARTLFERTLELAPNDGPSRLYVERTRTFIANPPPEDWDSVYTAQSKSG